MTRRIGSVVVVAPEPARTCERCGAVAETRPYGPKGERVCFPCGMKDEPAAERAFAKVLGVRPARTRR